MKEENWHIFYAVDQGTTDCKKYKVAMRDYALCSVVRYINRIENKIIINYRVPDLIELACETIPEIVIDLEKLKGR